MIEEQLRERFRKVEALYLGAAMFAATAAGIYPKVEDAMAAMGSGFDAEYTPPRRLEAAGSHVLRQATRAISCSQSPMTRCSRFVYRTNACSGRPSIQACVLVTSSSEPSPFNPMNRRPTRI